MADNQIGSAPNLRCVGELRIRAVAMIPFLTGPYPPLYHSIIAAFYALFGKTIDAAQWANLPAIALLFIVDLRHRTDDIQTFRGRDGGGYREFLSPADLAFARNDHRLLARPASSRSPSGCSSALMNSRIENAPSCSESSAVWAC